MSNVIGIDLGTTYCCVAVFLNGNVEIVPNEQGNRTTPSIVAFTDEGCLVGDFAKDEADANPSNTVFDAKRLIGRKFADPCIQGDLPSWPYRVIDVGGIPKYEVQYRGEIQHITPEEVSSMVLAKMKDYAEAFLGVEVSAAVITVPAHFNDSQRQATKDAGAIAGLNVVRIINEPTAAALAFGLDKKTPGERRVLVYDLGGGTFDVSVLSILEGSLFKVLATAGDTHLGGADFDKRMTQYLCDQFQLTHNVDLRTSVDALQRVRCAAEHSKCILSTATACTIEMESLYNEINFCVTITREVLEQMINDLLCATMTHVETALCDAKLDKSLIDDVVLIGGSSRIPKVQELLHSYFDSRQLTVTQNPNEAVAFGAAILGALLCGDQNPQLRDVILMDVTPLSLGIEIAGGIMSTIIGRNTCLPCKCMQLYTTYVDNQKSVEVQVFEGERPMSRDNNLLGTFKLWGVSPALRGVPKIEVEFDLDVNGILNVSARDTTTGVSNNILIVKHDGRLSPEDIAKMLNDAERFKEDDERERMRIEMRSQLERYLYIARRAVVEFGNLIRPDQAAAIQASCGEVELWMEQHKMAEKEEYVAKNLEVQMTCLPLMQRLHDVDVSTNMLCIEPPSNLPPNPPLNLPPNLPPNGPMW